jgi:hypothetical protein
VARRLREFVLTGKPMPEEVLSLVSAAADGIPRRTLVKITRRFAAIAARKLVSLRVERGADSAALSGRALVATHDVVSVVLTRPRAVGFAGAHRLDDLERHILGMRSVDCPQWRSRPRCTTAARRSATTWAG